MRKLVEEGGGGDFTNLYTGTGYKFDNRPYIINGVSKIELKDHLVKTAK